MFIVYTTCRDCGGLLHVTNRDTVHPTCTPRPTKIEQLTEDFLAAVKAGDNQIANDIQAVIKDFDSRPPRLLEAALKYATWGWPVFPLKQRSKQPATKHGFKDATTDTSRIEAWWTRYPDHNIGLPTGTKFDVIDIDVPEGLITYEKLIEADALPNSHGMVSTASGGVHHYICPLGGGNLAGTLPGIDFRGVGGYVVAPPSTLGRDLKWSWGTHPSPIITGADI